jgi:hypothetical protein
MASGRDLEAALVGSVAGTGATVAMSALMVAGRRSGLMPSLPPQDIASELVERSPLEDEVHRRGRTILGWLLHFGFGAAAGALYAVLRRRFGPALPGPAAGIPYALLVWALSYLGWVPALRFLPSALDDRPGRPLTMIAAHVVFGLLLEWLVVRLRRGAPAAWRAFVREGGPRP